MQSSNARSGFTNFSKPQTGLVYQRPLGLPLPFPVRAGMDIPDPLGNKKHKRTAPINDELRRYQASLQLTSGSGYAMNNHQGFGSNWHNGLLTQPNGMPYPAMASSQQSPPPYGTPGYMTRQDSQSTFADENFGSSQARPTKLPAKPFPCSFADCSKAFARRSDLSRHERIHTGVRPHCCDWQSCGRSFIQRSALTVHRRVHTGEKPHMCHYCSKAFSDSSSLARHRRIHSGTRPYKCEFANCQKTFTRRTTLTRHQGHHVGTTMEQAAAEVNAVLAAAHPNPHRYSTDSSPAEDSHQPSPITERPHSGSPYAELPPMTAGLQRQHSNGYPHQQLERQHSNGYLPQQLERQHSNGYAPQQLERQHSNGCSIPQLERQGSNGYPAPQLERQHSNGYPSQQLGLPAHLRADYQQSSNHTTNQLNGHPLQNFTSAPQQQRSVTSYPTPYGPPQPLEPPANGTASGGASPHLLPWHSPGPGIPGTLPPIPNMENAAYHEQGYGQLGAPHLGNHQMNGHPLYYSQGVQRPQSTEPRDYQSHMPSQVSLPQERSQAPPMDPQDSRQGPYMWRRDMPDRSQDDPDNH